MDRLGNVEMENEGFRRTVGELRNEVGELRAQLAKAGVGTTRAGWTARWSGLSTSISSFSMNQTDEKRGTSTKGKAIHDHTPQDRFHNSHHPHHLEYDGPVSSTPVPISETHQRRFNPLRYRWTVTSLCCSKCTKNKMSRLLE